MNGYAVGPAEPASSEKTQVADTLHVRLKTARGVEAQIEHCREPEAGPQTRLEVSVAVPADFRATLDVALASANLLPLTDGEGARDMEYFLDSASCA